MAQLKDPKVFCIGFHKTGTSSMRDALKVLGYTVTGPDGVNDPRIGETVYEMAFGIAEEFDAFQDNPWPILFKELDERFPGSKYVLTMRDPDSWIRSQVDHFGTRETPMREWIYGVGCPEGNESVYLERYQLHNAEVVEYFKDRPDDIIEMDLAGGDGWDKLCLFLGSKVPDRPFPHANAKQERLIREQSIVEKFSQVVRKHLRF